MRKNLWDTWEMLFNEAILLPWYNLLFSKMSFLTSKLTCAYSKQFGGCANGNRPAERPTHSVSYATHMTNILTMLHMKVIHGLGIPHSLWIFMQRKGNIAIVSQCVFHRPFIANC